MERFDNMVVLSKAESTYGTDPTPTKAANAVLCAEVRVSPLVLTGSERKLVLPHYGNQGKLIAGKHALIEMDIEAAGSGAAGTAPAFGIHFKAGGMGETIVASTSVTYAPITNSAPSNTHWLYWDGAFHKFLGARCDVSWRFKAMEKGIFTFAYVALYTGPTAVAMPTDPTLSAYVEPARVNDTNTDFTLHSYAAALEELSGTLANEMKYRNRPGVESVDFIGRTPKGSLTIEAPALGTKDYFAISVAGTKAALNLVHNTVAGNIITINKPYTQLGEPKPVNLDGVKGYQMDYDFSPSAAGNDEVTIAFT